MYTNSNCAMTRLGNKQTLIWLIDCFKTLLVIMTLYLSIAYFLSNVMFVWPYTPRMKTNNSIILNNPLHHNRFASIERHIYTRWMKLSNEWLCCPTARGCESSANIRTNAVQYYEEALFYLLTCLLINWKW